MTNYDILKEYEAHKTPVPSYEEYLESESHCAVYSEVNKSLKEENEQLKELLKECHTQLLNKPIREIQYDIKMAELKDLLKRIYEAIRKSNVD